MNKRILGMAAAALLLSACGDDAPATPAKGGKAKGAKAPVAAAPVEEAKPAS